MLALTAVPVGRAARAIVCEFTRHGHLGNTHPEAAEDDPLGEREQVVEGVRRGSGLRCGGHAAPQPLLLARAVERE